MRQLNSALVLDTIATEPGVSRAGIAHRTGLAKATVSTLVDRLTAARLVADGEPAPRAGRGRRASGLDLSPHGPHGLGIEIGVDHLACLLVDLTGTVRHRRIAPGGNRNRTPAQVLARAARLVAGAVTAARHRDATVGGLGVAVPGLVEHGTLRHAPNLGWRDLDVAADLAERTGVRRVDLGNEANLAALAEWQHTRQPDFARISGEIGIGAGVLLGGALFTGVRGLAGELGHLCVQPGGADCRCGATGCLETVAGQEAILRAGGIAPDCPQPLRQLTSRLHDEDSTALTAVTGAGRFLGIAVAGLVQLLDVPRIVLGGAYAELEPWLRAPVQSELDERVAAPVQVTRSVLDTAAAAYGGAIGAVRSILADPDRFLSDSACGHR